MHYSIVIAKSGDTYSAYIHDLPGCTAVGATEDEAEAGIRAALNSHLEGLRKQGKSISEPEYDIEYIEVTSPRGVSVDFDELEMAFNFASANGGFSCRAYVCSGTGKVYLTSDESEVSDEDLPDDLETSEQYLPVPTQSDLDLGVRLVFRFVDREMPEAYEQVDAIFHKKGAYGRFKQLLESRGKLERWYEFENQSVANALREWCEENGFTVRQNAGPAGS